MEETDMKKTFKMRDLECAHCAQKMEDAIRKIEGVEEVAVSFMAQKLTLSAEESLFDEIMKKVEKACRKIEPDCTIVM